jgi:hypothetical protein
MVKSSIERLLGQPPEARQTTKKNEGQKHKNKTICIFFRSL